MNRPTGHLTRSMGCERKSGVHYNAHPWLRRVCSLMIGAVVMTISLPAAESPARAELEGDLGRKE